MKPYMKELTSNLKKDKELAMAWKANIAMAYIDTEAQYKKKRNSLDDGS